MTIYVDLLLMYHLPPFGLLAGRSTEASRVLPDHMSCIKAELLDHLPDRPSIAIALRPQLVGQSIEEQLEEPSTITSLLSYRCSLFKPLRPMETQNWASRAARSSLGTS